MDGVMTDDQEDEPYRVKIEIDKVEGRRVLFRIGQVSLWREVVKDSLADKIVRRWVKRQRAVT